MRVRAGWVAQLVEQRTENPCVGGSIPPPATSLRPQRREDEGCRAEARSCVGGLVRRSISGLRLGKPVFRSGERRLPRRSGAKAGYESFDNRDAPSFGSASHFNFVISDFAFWL